MHVALHCFYYHYWEHFVEYGYWWLDLKMEEDHDKLNQVEHIYLNIAKTDLLG